jgi:serine/threonine protein kinase
MGEVYKARDTRLDRIVAIKVVREKFSDRFGLIFLIRVHRRSSAAIRSLRN